MTIILLIGIIVRIHLPIILTASIKMNKTHSNKQKLSTNFVSIFRLFVYWEHLDKPD